MDIVQQKFDQYFLQAPFQVQNDGRLLIDTQHNVCLFDYYENDGFVEPEMVKSFRQAYALCMLQREGIDSKDLHLQEQIAEFTFDYYPFVFRLCEMSMSYLYHFILKRYEPGYVFVRCSTYREDMFIFNKCRDKWTIYPVETIFRLKCDNYALFITTSSKEEIRISYQAAFKEETSQKLGLVSKSPEYVFRQLFLYKAHKPLPMPRRSHVI